MTPTLLKTPERVVNFAQLLPLQKSDAPVPLTISRPRPAPLQLVRTTVRALDLQLRASAPKLPVNLKRLQADVFTMLRTSGSMSRAAGTSDLRTEGLTSVKLPYGMPRFVNAATLKRMLKAKPSDMLLRRVADRWEIAEDGLGIDLLDESVEFRIGAVQIFS